MRLISKNVVSVFVFSILYTIFPLISSPAWAEDTLSSSERVVSSYDELKDALSSDNGITTVYFGADITMKPSGIKVHSSKANVVISGINPLNPDQSTPYSLIDYPLDSYLSTIYIDNSGVRNLLVSDLNITGKNFYGPITAHDITDTAGMVIAYQRVNYSGPQIGYNRRGTLCLIDCSVSINRNNGGSDNQEFSEAKNLIFEGNNTINTITNDFSLFWHPSGGSFEIKDNSSLAVTALNMDFLFGMFYGGKINLTVGKNAAFQATISGIVNHNDQAVLDNVEIGENGFFRLETTKTSIYTIMNTGRLFVDKNAEFMLYGYGGSSYLLAQRTGDITVSEGSTFHLIAEKGYSSLLALYEQSLICLDPFSILFYNPTGRTIQSETAAGKLHIETQQLNYWTTAGKGGFDDPPKYHWHIGNDKQFILDGTIAIAAKGGFTELSSNYPQDTSIIPPSKSTFDIVSARVLSFGRLDLNIYELDNKPPVSIQGMTAPEASIRASFTQNGVNAIAENTADSSGYYSIPLDSPLTPDTTAIVKSSIHFLTAVSSAAVIPAKIELTIPEKLVFSTAKIAARPQTISRADSEWGITIRNGSANGNNLRLYLRAPLPLTLQNSPGLVLEHALVYVDDADSMIPLDSKEALLIYQHSSSAPDITHIRWDVNHGIFAHIPPGSVVTGHYLGALEWIWTDTP